MPTQFLGTQKARDPFQGLMQGYQFGSMLSQQLAGKREGEEEKEKAQVNMFLQAYQNTTDEYREMMRQQSGWSHMMDLVEKYYPGMSVQFKQPTSTKPTVERRPVMPAAQPLTMEQLKAQTFRALTPEQQQRVVTGEKLPEEPPFEPKKQAYDFAFSQVRTAIARGKQPNPTWLKVIDAYIKPEPKKELTGKDLVIQETWENIKRIIGAGGKPTPEQWKIIGGYITPKVPEDKFVKIKIRDDVVFLDSDLNEVKRFTVPKTSGDEKLIWKEMDGEIWGFNPMSGEVVVKHPKHPKLPEKKFSYQKQNGDMLVFENGKFIKRYPAPEKEEKVIKNIWLELVSKAMSATKPQWGIWTEEDRQRAARILDIAIDQDPRLDSETKTLWKSYIPTATGVSLSETLIPTESSREDISNWFLDLFGKGDKTGTFRSQLELGDLKPELDRIYKETGSLDEVEKFLNSKGYSLDQYKKWLKKTRK